MSHSGIHFCEWGCQLCSRYLCVGLLILWHWQVQCQYSFFIDGLVTDGLDQAVLGC